MADNTIAIKSGTMIIEKGEPVNRLYMVTSGEIEVERGGVYLTLAPGSILGLSDAFYERYESSYTAISDSVVLKISYEGPEDFHNIFEKAPYYIFGFAKGVLRQCKSLLETYSEELKVVEKFYSFLTATYAAYLKLCTSLEATPGKLVGYENLAPFETDGGLNEWEKKYIDAMNEIDDKKIGAIYGENIDIVIGLIGCVNSIMEKAARIIININDYYGEFAHLLMDSKGGDLFERLFELQIFAAERGKNQDAIKKTLATVYKFVSTYGFLDENDLKLRLNEYKNHNFEQDATNFAKKNDVGIPDEDMIEHISNFAGMDDEFIKNFKSLLNTYNSLPDKTSRDPEPRKIRNTISELFYQLYEKTFFATFTHLEQSILVKLFLNFGIVDIKSFPEDVAKELAHLCNNLSICYDANCFTVFTWLSQIYVGAKEPSRNDMDLDYRAYILEERKNGNIRENEVEDKLHDNISKVKFEINNFFRSANKITSGHVTSFCPVTDADSFGGNITNMLVTAAKLNNTIKEIEKVDFSIFYRDTLFSDPNHGINSEIIKKHVAPDFILMPNSGSKAMLWQETGGVKLDSPGRIIFPLFTFDEIGKLMITCLGAYRWEIAKREAGLRWNDISEPSLTSEFYDLYTFYKKNRELTTEQKEKIKTLLLNSRSLMRDAFAKQYALWVTYESSSNMRLLRQEREIMAKYCPFAKAYRQNQGNHPAFAELWTRYDVKTKKNVTHAKQIVDNFIKAGGGDAWALNKTLEFYEM